MVDKTLFEFVSLGAMTLRNRLEGRTDYPVTIESTP